MDEESLLAAIEQLKDKRSEKRRIAARRLRKAPHAKAADALIAALKKEVLDRRTWETQYQMIMAIAACNAWAAKDVLNGIMAMDLEPMVHLAAGDALVRLGEDVDSALKAALESQSLPRIEGALRAVAMMRLTPAQRTIDAIVSCASLPPNRQLRFWVAAAAAGWHGNTVQRFLEECLLDDSLETQRAARSSLEGRFLKWNPL